MTGPTVIAAGGSFAIISFVYLLHHLCRKMHKVSVKDKVVLITGASSGLGEACAQIFFEAGAKVILCARRQTELDRVRSIMLEKMQDGRHIPEYLTLDVTNYDELPLKIEQAYAFHNNVDILINNAGMSYRGEIVDTLPAVDQDVMAVNYFGQVALTKAVLPHMVRRKSGHIVFVSSLQGKFSIPFRSAYSASKHALQAFSDCLRTEMAEYNIKVSCISPGYIQTNLSLNAVTGSGNKYGVMDPTTAGGMSPLTVASRILQHVETNKSGEMVISSTLHKVPIILRPLLPSLYFYIMKKRAKKQRSAKIE